VKTLFMLLVLCLVGLGGYQLGRQPNSPDVVGRLKGEAARVDWQAAGHKANNTFAAARQKLSTWAENRQQTAAPDPEAPAVAPKGPSASAAGDTRRWSQPQGEIPQCW
jgi:hypothetical protein